MPESGPEDVIPIGDHADVCLQTVQALIPSAIFHVGVFPTTMPDPFEPIAFAHIDCDQYRSCLAAIDCFYPLLIVGGIMLFDDYNVTHGVRKAVDERFANLHLTREGKAYIIKI